MTLFKVIIATTKAGQELLGAIHFFIPGNQLSKTIEPGVSQLDDPSSRLELGIGLHLFFLCPSWTDVWDEAMVLGDFLFANMACIQAQVPLHC